MIYKYEKRSYKTFFRRKNSRRFIKNELRSGTRAKKRRNEIYQLKIPIDLLPGLRFRWWQSWWRLTRGRTWSRGRHAICSRILRYRVFRNNSAFFPLNFQNFACSASPSSTGRCYLTLHWNLLRAWFALSYMQKSCSKLGKLKVCQFVLKRWLIKMVRI